MFGEMKSCCYPLLSPIVESVVRAEREARLREKGTLLDRTVERKRGTSSSSLRFLRYLLEIYRNGMGRAGEVFGVLYGSREGWGVI